MAQNGTNDTNDESELGRTKPSPVWNLSEYGATNDSISAGWNKPNGMIDQYTFSCSAGTEDPSSPIAEDNSGSYMTSCVGLSTAGANYNITVTSQSGDESSDESTITITALPNPVVLTESDSTVDSVSATWMKPAGEVTSYDVQCSSGNVVPPAIQTGDGPFSASCTDLPTPGEEYTMNVTSLSNGKSSDITPIALRALPEAVTLYEESNMVNTTTIAASWNMPTGIVDYYVVSCFDGTASPAQVNPSDDLTASCTGLSTPGDNYTIAVTSVSNGQLSAASTIKITALPEAVTLNEESDMVTTTTITASWTMPNGIVEYYEVSCSNGTASPARVNPSDALIASCTGLSIPGDNYAISVTSVSNGQRSATSTITITALPNAVSLSEGASNKTAVSATWTIPDSVVDTFDITCFDGTASPSAIPVESSPTSDTFTAYCIGLPTPGLEYNLSVVAISNNRRSVVSAVGVHAAPTGVDLTEGSASTTSVSVIWAQPDSAVESYSISCSSGDASPATIADTSQTSYVASCVNLPVPGDTYTMTVHSIVDSGATTTSSSIDLVSLPEAVELSEGEYNKTAISATWTVPNSVVDNFNITCSNGTASPASIPVISSQAGQQLTAYCVGLPKSGEQYDLSVVAISKKKLSAVSTIGVFALPLGVALEEGPSTLMSVSASWMRQEDQVESYSISCNHGDASPSTIEDTDQESFSAACVNLTGPGATYSMTVNSELGTDSSSNGTRASSLINLVAVPASVESISVTQYATTTVDIQWNLMQCSDCVYNYFLLIFEPDSQEPIRVDYTTGVNEYSSQVLGLTQGRSYNFTVVSVSGVGVEDATLKTSEEKSVDQRTVPATPFGLVIVSSQRELNLVWEYQGDADDFTITITPDHGRAVFNENFTRPAAEITGLTPGTIYDIAIVTVSGDERSEPITNTARTKPDKPSPVRNPQAEAVDKNTITLTYESPIEPNGEIESYMIRYVGTRDDNPSHEFSDVYSPPVLTVTYNDLYPGFSYTFTIIAVNDGEFESDRISTAPVETPQEEPPPVPGDYPYESNTVFSETTDTSFAVVLPDDLFSHENGELLTFAVIITREANDPTVGSTEQNYEEARAQNAYVTAIDIPYPFPPTFGSNRKRRATDPSATVDIGEDGSCVCSPKEYCNGALDDNTQYYYAFRAYNGVGDVTSSTFGPVTTESTGSSSSNIVSYGKSE
eukprot:XP_011673271.1 PREDICTED: receptor-type tyrosine-protein phosphatase beta [Strongylocentrotus purpuratus]